MTDNTVPATPDEPMYEQLGDKGNPFTNDNGDQNPALPDQGSSDGENESVADEVPGPQG